MLCRSSGTRLVECKKRAIWLTSPYTKRNPDTHNTNTLATGTLHYRTCHSRSYSVPHNTYSSVTRTQSLPRLLWLIEERNNCRISVVRHCRGWRLVNSLISALVFSSNRVFCCLYERKRKLTASVSPKLFAVFLFLTLALLTSIASLSLLLNLWRH